MSREIILVPDKKLMGIMDSLISDGVYHSYIDIIYQAVSDLMKKEENMSRMKEYINEGARSGYVNLNAIIISEIIYRKGVKCIRYPDRR
ncbi:type II toxin-antitoxin system ParD family antitoxin [Pantoea sp. At-9b]|uniref:type II toxin-antitoxin system ParD family antitoxin n=1 Tax=Pantoea sp. (strain At-9b) TaxID=592316 RepID=UPI00059F47C7|nr:type II toxin-antitoxin system ParD family antitoxin [Pantoea sp. At-9b]